MGAALSFYKPTKTNKGSAASFTLGEKDGKIYVSIVRQISWDDKNKVGKFASPKTNPEKCINIKFSTTEIGSMLLAFRTRTEKSFFHSFNESKTQIKIYPYTKKGDSEVTGMALVVSKNIQNGENAENFFVGFYFEEVELILSFLQRCLWKSFDIADENFKNQYSNSSKNSSSNRGNAKPKFEEIDDEISDEDDDDPFADLN